jgi:pimeloyl-ACP methyl ester carboxylesterase
LTLSTGGLNIQGEDDAYDFGSGAGFYVDATKAPYNAGYNMYSYVTDELPQTVFAAFPQLDSSRVSITGHSMGGHGALTLVSYTLVKSGYLLYDTRAGKGYVFVECFCLINSSVPPQPWQVQVRLCVRTDHEPDELPLGPEGVQGLLRR